MRINSNLGVPEGQPPDRAGAAGSAPAPKPQQVSGQDAGDQAHLSSDATQLSKLSQALATAPEIRQDRVAALSQAVGSGNYSVSNQQIAQSMLRDFRMNNSSGL